jgi:hypothetical protein
LYDYEIVKYAKRHLKIPNFRGVFMRDTLPIRPYANECAIVNLDLNKNRGTHWVAYIKSGNTINYFDSFGDLKPPQELVEYFGRKANILYNNNQYQKYNQYNCGHLCLEFLYKTLCSD